MIGFLLNLPGWAALVPIVMILLAAVAALLLVPPRLWRPLFIGLGAAVVVWLGVLVARDFYQRGKADCAAAHAEAAAKQRAADQKRTDDADASGATAQAGVTTIERHYTERTREIFRDRPAGPCIDADGLRRIREADAATAGAAAGQQPAELLPPAIAGEGDGSGRS